MGKRARPRRQPVTTRGRVSRGGVATKRKRGAEGTVKYGSLSRKQKDTLREYGELDPVAGVENDHDTDLAEHIARKRRRIVTEAELKEESRAEEQHDADGAVSQSLHAPGDTQCWSKPNAYRKLLKLLQKGSSNKELYERRRREEEGVEDLDENDEGELKGAEGEHVLKLTNEEVKKYREEYGEDAVQVLNSGNSSAEGDDDHGDVAAASENEDENASEDDSEDERKLENNPSSSVDEFEAHYGDGMIDDVDERVIAVDRKAWKSTTFQDGTFCRVTLMDCLQQPEANGDEVGTREELDLDKLHVKKRLQESWKRVNLSLGKKESKDVSDPLQRALFTHMNRYRDLVFADRNGRNAESIVTAYCLHALNHVFKTRDRVLKNTAKICHAQAQDKDVGELRDQGFTRPKVLIVVPFKNGAKRIIETMIALSGAQQVEHKKRFSDEFSPVDEEKEEDRDPSKPADYWDVFSGNIDDYFRIGIKITRKTMKLFSRFYASDILIASPLGLRMIIGSEGDKKREYDFLSSIEVMILDQCEIFQMQNWTHIETIFAHMNLIPKEARDCDFSRVRGWYLDGRAAYFRQTMVFASFLTPEINSLFNTHMKNICGKVKFRRSYEGVMLDIVPQVKQVFTRIDPPSYTVLDDFRFKHFIENTLPALRHSSLSQAHTLIFIPSYFDFVRVRNHFLAEEISFGALSEYTSKAEMSRARSDFFHGRRKILLVTERFHFFRRYRIRGARRVVFYAPPDHPQFYSEFLNFLALPLSPKRGADEAIELDPAAGSAGVVGVIFSKYDCLRVERIVGSPRAAKMINGDKSIFMFV